MSFSPSVSRFDTLLSDASSAPCPLDLPVRLLWGADPFLCSRMLAAIGGEAANRRKPISAVYDPLLPQRLTAITVEGMGTFTLSFDALPCADGLIDCTVPRQEPSDTVQAKVTALSHRRTALAEEIARTGRVLGGHRRLLETVSETIPDIGALTVRAERIARRTLKGTGAVQRIPVRSQAQGSAVWRLPFPTETKIAGISSAYCLSGHFLRVLENALNAAARQYCLLTSALTEEIVGIYLPTAGVCYLADADEAQRERKLSLERFFLPHTGERRREWRHLASAAGVLAGRLDRLLTEYRTLAKEEEEVRSSLYSESRLQSFRKRLLIDLFC